mgnify:CR=1 FL=1
MTEIKAAGYVLVCVASFLYVTERDAGRPTFLACVRAAWGFFCVIFGALTYAIYVNLHKGLSGSDAHGLPELGAYLCAYGMAIIWFVAVRLK